LNLATAGLTSGEGAVSADEGGSAVSGSVVVFDIVSTMSPDAGSETEQESMVKEEIGSSSQ
jgi:hypothetical protein